MEKAHSDIYLGQTPLRETAGDVDGAYVEMDGEQYYCIRNYDRMPPFFISLVSSSDHWMFISSTGGLTAGRINAESSLFPYYTDDKVTENHTNTGPLSIFRVTRDGKTSLWEPFSAFSGDLYRVERNIYKNILGNKLIFEERNLDLGLCFRYAWRTSERYGFVRSAWLQNVDEQPCSIQALDGLRNLLPYGATVALQTTFSNLLNAYKRNESESETGLGMFSLSSTLTDLAEPSESLRTTVVWSLGLDVPRCLVSARQVDAFRHGAAVSSETDIRGERGAYFAQFSVELAGGQEKAWHLVADVNQDAGQVAELLRSIKADRTALQSAVEEDIQQSSFELQRIIASADGLQVSAQQQNSAHHFANVLFNTMRGGIFAENYAVGRADLLDFVSVRNRVVLQEQTAFFDALPETIGYAELMKRAAQTGSADLERLCFEYLPLTFSRRHGDPSRPWNRFSINIKKPDGSRRLDYQGNWRDIFQNWEPLALAYPGFVEGMICKFLNATTADGYNPYRVTRDGIEWEIPVPDDPWANIGYWGDHQIIYLEKLLELSRSFHPGQLQGMLSRRMFSHANVPYRIKSYDALLEDPYNTIDFDWEQESRIEKDVHQVGTDSRLLNNAGRVFHVTMTEKLLGLLLAKLANLVPEGGIWMNTQRPEWNDANNALVGKGLSVVTLGYLRRFIAFFEQILEDGSAPADFSVTREMAGFFDAVNAGMRKNESLLAGVFSDEQRRGFMDELGWAASAYRTSFYKQGLSGEFTTITASALLDFLRRSLRYVEHSLRANRRADALYHAYNVLRLDGGRAVIGHLDEMLEGQVSILSSGMLSSAEALQVLRSLRNSRLYRADQHSYILYPDRDLPGFLRKNHIPAEEVSALGLVAKLVDENDQTLLFRDVNGAYHFNGTFRNEKDVKKVLSALQQRSDYAELVAADEDSILALFEKVFNHHAFTGRSGTFFAYEGLGSIYWHMVSKLLLAVQENYFRAADPESRQPLAEAYFDIRRGLGYNKSPQIYGTFPADPYSHTPAGAGAKQPGMTGQVKEEILTRFGELGLFVENGIISFRPTLLPANELTQADTAYPYIDVFGALREIPLPAGSLSFTFCQVPVIYRADGASSIEIHYADGAQDTISGGALNLETCQHIFDRDGRVERLVVGVSLVNGAK